MRFNKYPKMLRANVLLLDGEIINWKTGTTSWEGYNWINSRQQVNLIRSGGEIHSEVLEKNILSEDQWDKFFEVDSVEFYKQYKVHEKFKGFKPY